VSLIPVDYILALYNIVLIAVWAPLATTTPVARWMIAVHTAALGLPWLLLRAGSLRSRGVAALREVYPVIWLGAFWKELGIHCELVGSAPNDALLASLDRAVFHVNANVTWPAAAPAVWLSELMQGVYFLYYVLFAGLVLYLVLRSRRPITRDTILRLSAAYTAAYLVYAIAPTVGPMWMSEFPRLGAQGLFRTLNDALQAAGDAAGTAFPSTHTAGSITLAWLAWRYCPRWVAVPVTALALAIIPATVYTQNHFLLDAVCGAMLGLWLQASAIPALRGAYRWMRFHKWRIPRAAPKTEPESV